MLQGGVLLELRKKVILIIIAVVALLAFLAYWNVFRFERVRVSSGPIMNIVGLYNNYYFKAELRPGFFNFGGGRPLVKDVYFLRGQRARMVERIREDILAALATLMVLYSYKDIFNQCQKTIVF